MTSLGNHIQRLIFTSICLAVPVLAHADYKDFRAAIDGGHLVAYLVAILIIASFVMLFFNRLSYYREQDVIKKAKRLNAQLAMVLEANQTQIWTYNVQDSLFKTMSMNDGRQMSYSPIDFAQLYDHDDFIEMRNRIKAVRDGEEYSDSIIVKSALSKDASEPQRIYEVTISILYRDKHNHPTVILGTQQDITEDQKRSEKVKEMTLRYHTIFNSSLIDMIYYNADGTIADINDKACESFNFDDRESILNTKTNIADIPSMKDIDFNNTEQLYSSSIINLSEIGKPTGILANQPTEGNLYYEQDLTVFKDASGENSGIVIAGRNVTEMVNYHHQQVEASKLLEKTTKDIQQYIQNINYSMKVSNVLLVTYQPYTHELTISNDLEHTQHVMPQLRALPLVHRDDRRKALKLIRKMDNRQKVVLSDTFQTVMHDKEGHQIYLNFHLMPITDKDGVVTHYFGLCRDVTELIYTEQRLQEETNKALEEEKLKNTFLLNMSYELRTPLNAVVGFAELFNAEHDEEDEPVFAEEIKKNTNTLLSLINDILYISRLDAHMIEFNYQECDFALLFDGWCYMGWSNITPDVKVSVENPYNSLMVSIDQQNLCVVIQKTCFFSSLSTKEGTLRAKYEYRHGELMITIEDSGKGFDAEQLAKLFDRFSQEEEREDKQGTGLDLPIVKELIEQMNGSIEVQSEPGKGTLYLISIPCKMSLLDKKAEVYAL